MPKVINPRAMIEEYLEQQGYLPQNNRNSSGATHNAILEGAARAMKDLIDVNFSEAGLCWDQSVSKTGNVYEAFGEAVINLESELLPNTFSWPDEMPLVTEKIKQYL